MSFDTENRIRFTAQSILTPMPAGTKDAGSIGPVLPLEQAKDVIAWHDRHRERAAAASSFGFVLIRWVTRQEAEHLYPPSRQEARRYA